MVSTGFHWFPPRFRQDFARRGTLCQQGVLWDTVHAPTDLVFFATLELLLCFPRSSPVFMSLGILRQALLPSTVDVAN